ncbi:MAG: D-glucuronyl C5-epimerase family protein [Gammaproteobacteria bacterium]
MRRVVMNFARYLVPGSSVAFWHTPIAPVFYDFPTLGDYFIDFTSKTAYKGPFDARGIPLLNYRGSIGTRYNPCATAQYALGWYQRWRRGDEGGKERFFTMADWLRDTLEADNQGQGFWFYDFDLDAYGARAPWASALAQAQGVAVLLRAARASSNAHYARAAASAYAAMTSPVERGGLLLRRGDLVFLEEVVSDRPTAILDGYIFAMFGVRDYAFYTGDSASVELWNACVRTLAQLLPEYDLGYWSRADLYNRTPPMPASAFYHGLHIAQLKVLERLASNSIFGEYANRWEMLASNRISGLRVLLSKIYFKLRYY